MSYFLATLNSWLIVLVLSMSVPPAAHASLWDKIKDTIKQEVEEVADEAMQAPDPALKSKDIAMVQHQLNTLGYDAGTADGKFGSKTEKAIKHFQLDNDMAIN